MADENQDFKVVDRRASSGSMEEPKRAAQGEGFVMKDSGSDPEAPLQIDFSTFLLSLATGTIINLGLAPDPVTKRTEKNLELAKQNIELLLMLREKTKGNLTSDEQKLMESLLAEVQLRFVEVSKK